MDPITYDERERIMSPTILLASGRYFDFHHPDRTPISIEDVAHGLSHLCRFTGQCREFYSVAQHSVLVSALLPRELQLWGLLHDAVEAVMGDVASPLKKLLPEYKQLELRVERVILRQFGLDADAKPAEVKHADLVALRTEQRDLMNAAGGLWTSLHGIEPHPSIRISGWAPAEARRRFLLRYRELQAQAVPQDPHFRAAA